MGALIIGVGLVLAALGAGLGLIGSGSLAQPSGIALIVTGGLGFVGGLMLVALGFVHRALVTIADKLDGVLHVEPEDYYAMEEGGSRPADILDEVARRRVEVEAAIEAANAPGAAAKVPAMPAPVPAPPPVSRPAPPPVVAPVVMPEVPAPEFLAPEPVVVRAPTEAPRAAEPTAPEPAAAEEPASSGLPSWFRRKRPTDSSSSDIDVTSDDLPTFDLGDLAAPEPAISTAPPKVAPPAPAPASREMFAREPRLSEPRLTEPRAPEPRLPEPRMPDLRAGEPRNPPLLPPEPKITLPEPRVPDFRGFEPRVPEPEASRPLSPFLRDEPNAPPTPAPAAAEALDPGPGAPPAFLRATDLLLDEPEEEAPAPSVTVLKAGVIGGMAYKLYSDGSIEADLPDGTLRFGSLQELRDHVSGAARG